jgi:hypothetical protein
MPRKPTPPTPATERSLPDMIRDVSQHVSSLTGLGCNRRAVVVLLKDATGLGKREVEIVLDGLAELEKRYCK